MAELYDPRPARRIRMGLAALLLAMAAVFGVAAWIKPYDTAGQPLRLATHQQLGLPPCTFYVLTGRPCPSCGMTTSFALFVRGDFANSLRANAVGTLLALCGVVVVPWGVAGIVAGRFIGIQSASKLATRGLIIFVTLMLVRWVVVLVKS